MLVLKQQQQQQQQWQQQQQQQSTTCYKNNELRGHYAKQGNPDSKGKCCVITFTYVLWNSRTYYVITYTFVKGRMMVDGGREDRKRTLLKGNNILIIYPGI